MNKTSRVLSQVAATAIVLGGTLGFAGPASGATHSTAHRVYCRSNHHGAYVCFQPYGDHLFVKDTAKDGYSAAAYWETSYGSRGVCLNKNGAGTVVDCNYKMHNNWTIRFWAVDVNLPTNTYRYWSAERAATI